MALHSPLASAPEGPGWQYARPHAAAAAPIEIVHVVRGAAGGLEVEIPGSDRTLALAAFEWLGPVAVPSLSTCTDGQPVSHTAAIEHHLKALLSAMRAKGYCSPSVAVLLSASGDGVVVGTYLKPDADQAISMLDTAFTDRTLRWAQLQVLRLRQADEADAFPPASD
jgi:hypothetical protein